MKKLPCILPLVALCVILSGCATAYQKLTPFAYTGGYNDKDLGRDVYRVSFSANGFTSRETAQCYWLYRCAELTLEKGFDGFQILSNIQLTEVQTPEEAFGTGTHIQPATYIYVPVYTPSDDSFKPYIEADIHLLKGPVASQPPKIFDARKLKNALEPHVAEPMKSDGNVEPHVHDYLLPEGTLSPEQKPDKSPSGSVSKGEL
jgi:hypothetical protein